MCGFLAARFTSLVTWPQTPCSLERLHSACARIHVKSSKVQLRNGRASRYSRRGSALTIRSSRDRFAASADHGNIVFCQGRKSVRLNSGVSATSCSFSQLHYAMRVLLAARCTSLVNSPQAPCSLERLHSACARSSREQHQRSIAQKA